MAVGPTDVVDPFDCVVRRLLYAVEVLHLVHRPGRTSLLGGAVVGQEHQDRVVQLPHGSEPIHEPADLVVRVIQERRERLLQPGGQTLLIVRQVVPGLNTGVAGRKGRTGIDHTEGDLALEPALAHDIPALVVASPVLVEIVLGRLVRRVGRAEGEVSEEGTIWTHALVVVDHQQELVHQVLGEVVALLWRCRRIDVGVISHQLGMELIGLARQEAVEAFEAPTERPVVERPRGGDIGARHQMPLTGTQRGVALAAKNLRDRGRRVGDMTSGVRKASDPTGEAPHPHRVLGAAGQQRRTRRRTHRRHMEVRELHPAGRQGVDVWRVDVGPVGTELGEPGVVEQHEHHIRRAVTRMESLLEIRLGVGQCVADRSFELSHVVLSPMA